MDVLELERDPSCVCEQLERDPSCVCEQLERDPSCACGQLERNTVKVSNAVSTAEDVKKCSLEVFAQLEGNRDGLIIPESSLTVMMMIPEESDDDSTDGSVNSRDIRSCSAQAPTERDVGPLEDQEIESARLDGIDDTHVIDRSFIADIQSEMYNEFIETLSENCDHDDLFSIDRALRDLDLTAFSECQNDARESSDDTELNSETLCSSLPNIHVNDTVELSCTAETDYAGHSDKHDTGMCISDVINECTQSCVSHTGVNQEQSNVGNDNDALTAVNAAEKLSQVMCDIDRDTDSSRTDIDRDIDSLRTDTDSAFIDVDSALVESKTLTNDSMRETNETNLIAADQSLELETATRSSNARNTAIPTVEPMYDADKAVSEVSTIADSTNDSNDNLFSPQMCDLSLLNTGVNRHADERVQVSEQSTSTCTSSSVDSTCVREIELTSCPVVEQLIESVPVVTEVSGQTAQKSLTSVDEPDEQDE